MKERLPVLLLPYTEIDFMPLRSGWDDGDHIEACFICGCPYMIIKKESVRDNDWNDRREIPVEQRMLGSQDHSFYCAKCGQSQGGIFVDNDKDTSERYPPE